MASRVISDMDGKVGIGTLRPATDLEVAGTVKATTVETGVVGTPDEQPLELRVNSVRGWRLEVGGNSSVNVVGGYAGN
jgi:hypothetical protein